MRVLVLLVVLFTCHVSCQQKILEKGKCQLSKAPTKGSFIKLKKNDKPSNVNQAQLTIKGTRDKTFDLNLDNLGQKEFLIYVDVDQLTDQCDIDVAGVKIEEVANPASEVAINSDFLVVGPATNAKLKFKGTAGQPLFTLASFRGSDKTSLEVTTGKQPQSKFSFSVMSSYENLFQAPKNALSSTDDIEVTIKDLKANEYLTFETSDVNSFKLPTNPKFHYACINSKCKLPLTPPTLVHLTVGKTWSPVEVYEKDQKIKFQVSEKMSYLKEMSQIVSEEGQLLIFKKTDFKVPVNTGVKVEGPVKNAVVTFEGNAGQELFTTTTFQGTGGASLEVTTGSQTPYTLSVWQKYKNILQVPDLTSTNDIKVKINNLEDKESLTFETADKATFNLPTDTTLHYECTNNNCEVTVNPPTLVHLTVEQSWKPVNVQDGDDKNNFVVTADKGYIKKMSRIVPDKEKILIYRFSQKAPSVAINSKVTVLGPMKDAVVNFKGTPQKQLFSSTTFQGTNEATLEVTTGSQTPYTLSVWQKYKNSLQVPDLTSDDDIKVKIKNLEANEELIFETSDGDTFKLPTDTTLHYECTNNNCEVTVDPPTLVHLTVEQNWKPVNVHDGDDKNNFVVTADKGYIKKMSRIVSDKEKILIFCSSQKAPSVAINSKVTVLGPAKGDVVNFNGTPRKQLFSTTTFQGTGGASLEVTTGSQTPYTLSVWPKYKNILQVPDLTRDDNIKVKLENLKDKESLTFETSDGTSFNLPTDPIFHYACTKTPCELPLKPPTLVHLTVEKTWKAVNLYEKDPKNKFQVNGKMSYLKKMEQIVSEEGQLLIFKDKDFKVPVNTGVKVEGPVKNAVVTFEGMIGKNLFTSTTFQSTDTSVDETSLKVKTKSQQSLVNNVMKTYENLLHVQASDLDNNNNIEVTIDELKAKESLTFITSDDSRKFPGLFASRLHYVCSMDGCSLPMRETLTQFIVLPNWDPVVVNTKDPDKEFTVAANDYEIKRIAQKPVVFGKGQIFIDLDIKVPIDSKNFEIDGPLKNAKLTFLGKTGAQLFTRTKLQSTGHTSLEIKTRSQVVYDFVVMNNYLNVLQVAYADSNDDIEVTIKDLKDQEILNFTSSENFKWDSDTTLNYVCMKDGCELPLPSNNLVQLAVNQDPHLIIAVLKNWSPVVVNEGDPKTEFRVLEDMSYIKKISQTPDKFGKGQFLAFFTSKPDKIEVETENLGFIGQEVSGFWTLPRRERAFDVKVEDPMDLTFSINNKLAQNDKEMQRTVSFHPNRPEFFYISPVESQERFKFHIKSNKEALTKILKKTHVPTVVDFSAGTSFILRDTNIGLLEIPDLKKETYLEIQSPTKSQIKLGSKVIDLTQPFINTLRRKDFDNLEYMQLKVFKSVGNVKDKIYMKRIDKYIAAEIVEGDNSLKYSREIHVPYSQQGYTLEIDNSLQNSDFAVLTFDNHLPRTLDKGSTDLVFIYEQDYNSKSFIEGRVIMEEGRELNLKGSKGIKPFELKSKDYYLKNNAAIFKPEKADYDYYLKFMLYDVSDEVNINLLNRDHLLDMNKKYETIKITKAEHQGKPVSVNITSTNLSKEARVLIDIQATPCSVNSCANNGICQDGQGLDFTCLCEDNFRGKRCELTNSSPHVKAAVWMVVGVVSLAFLMN